MKLFSPIEKISNRQATKVLEALLVALSVREENIKKETFHSILKKNSAFDFHTASCIIGINTTYKKICDELRKTILELEKEK